jgi:hypothetical protein
MKVRGKAVYENVLDIPEGQSGGFELSHVIEPAGKVFHLSSGRTAMMGGHKSGTVVYDHPTRWHQLLEDDGRWMIDLPIEQAQHDVALAPLHGFVLVGGLGVGYAVTALAKRRTVTGVVVVEKSSDVVALVAPHLLRDSVEARRKVTFVTADLFDYLKERPVGEKLFDGAFYDIWRSDGESTFFSTVLPLLRLSALLVKRVVCWNEDVMRGQLYSSLESRWIVAHEPRLQTPGSLTLDQLCEDSDSFWRAWSVPFFRWTRQENPDQKTREKWQAFYAAQYGQPLFAGVWEFMTGELVPELDVQL